MLLHRLILFICAFSIGVYAYAADITKDESDFNVICQIYTEAKNSSISKEQLSDYIFDNVERRVSSIDALESHTAVFNLEPAKRYPIFKESAEYSLKKQWDCEAVKTFMK